ncbi:MAG: hypothetical protein ACREJQ_01135 [bacterium]
MAGPNTPDTGPGEEPTQGASFNDLMSRATDAAGKLNLDTTDDGPGKANEEETEPAKAPATKKADTAKSGKPEEPKPGTERYTEMQARATRAEQKNKDLEEKVGRLEAKETKPAPDETGTPEKKEPAESPAKAGSQEDLDRRIDARIAERQKADRERVAAYRKELDDQIRPLLSVPNNPQATEARINIFVAKAGPLLDSGRVHNLKDALSLIMSGEIMSGHRELLSDSPNAWGGVDQTAPGGGATRGAAGTESEGAAQARALRAASGSGHSFSRMARSLKAQE